MLSFHQKIKTLMPGCWEFPRDLAVSPCSRQERSRLGSPSPAPPRDPARLRAGCPWPPRHPELPLPFGAGVVGLLSKGVVACGREKQTIGKSANSEHLLDGACSPSSRWGLSGCWKAQERRNEGAVGVKARKEPLKSLLMLAGPLHRWLAPRCRRWGWGGWKRRILFLGCSCCWRSCGLA